MWQLQETALWQVQILSWQAISWEQSKKEMCRQKMLIKVSKELAHGTLSDIRSFMGAGNSAWKFSKVGIWLSRLPSAQKTDGKVGLHSKITDFSVWNRNVIARMTTIWSYKAWHYYLKEFFTKNSQPWSITLLCHRWFALIFKKWISTAQKSATFSFGGSVVLWEKKTLH